MTHLPDLTAALLEAALRAGADAADALAAAEDSIAIEVREGALEHAERSEGKEIGLRVLVGQKQASISSSDLRADAITEMAERAVAMARVAVDDPYCGLAEPGALSEVRDADGLDLADATAADPAKLQEEALAVEAAARAVPGVSKVQSAGAYWGGTDLWLAATNGFAGGYRRTSWSLSGVAISGDGLEMERDYASETRTHATDLKSAREIGALAGERAVERAGSRKPPTGTFPVLYDERIAASLIGHLVGAVSGSAIARGSSWLSDAKGAAVLPDGLTLTEEPHRVRGPRSRPFDGEGLRTGARTIVADGVLTGWTLDLATGRQLGSPSTANAQRGISAPPSPGLSNLILTEGERSREDLIRDMGTGLWVTSMIGATINPTTGDYSRGASGFWVENGAIAYPVNECTIAGNLRDILRRIEPANDAKHHKASIVPSLLVLDMAIAGS